MAIDPTGGRKELERLLAGQSKRTQQLAQRVAKEVAAAVSGGAGAVQAVTQSMERAGVSQAVRTQVAEAVVQSLCVGNGIWPSISAMVDMSRLSSVALGHSWDGSGMTLSARLYGTDQAMRSEIIGAVQSHITAGADTWQTARKIYDGYGFGGALHKDRLPDLHKDLQNLVDDASHVLDPTQLAKLKARAKQMTAYADRLATGPLAAAYRQLSSELEKDLPKGVARLARIAAEEKARYHASRILRTETARAWGQGFHAQCMADSDVTGWRWETSSAHVIFDICDFHARADLYGMGPGIYPKTHHPSYPAHPHCLCQCSMVFKGETPRPRDQVDAGGKAAVKGMTQAERVRILGKPGANAFRGGADWKAAIKQWDPPVPFMRQVTGTGVQGWQPPLELSNGAKAVLVEAQAAAPKVRFADDGMLLPGESLTRKELDGAWSLINGGPILDAWNVSGKTLPLGLDEREAAMIYNYTGSGYVGLNRDLRDGNPPHAVHIAQQQILNSALTKMGLSRETRTYRNIHLYASQRAQFDKDMIPGHEFEWKGFTSTSTSQNVSKRFGGASFVIENPQGVDLRKISGIPTEDEFLVQSGARFRVKEVVTLSSGERIFIIEAL
jgi:hypothetical protein